MRLQSSEPRRGPGIATGVVLALVLSALVPAAAAASQPRITQTPVVAGTPQVGAIVEAQGARWDERPEPEASWQWVRCDGLELSERSCREIGGATEPTYTVSAADLGKRLRILLTVRNRDGWAWTIS